MVAITKFTREDIFDAVKLMYTSVANQPEKGFHFPTGRPACEFLGYPADQLDSIPATAVESFAGVGYPFRCNVIRPGDVILYHTGSVHVVRSWPGTLGPVPGLSRHR